MHKRTRRATGAAPLALVATVLTACAILVIASTTHANGGPVIPGGPVIIGTDEADDRGGFDECAGCGINRERDGDCTNSCFLADCDDPSRTVRVGGRGESNACRQFDGDQTACEQAWHVAGADGVPASCFFCENTDGKCDNVGECRGCGGNNARNGSCINACTPDSCEDGGLTLAPGGSPGTGQGSGSCRQFDGNQGACELAWHRTKHGLPTSCFFCQGTEGSCQAGGECRGCGRNNPRDDVCTNTCLPCADVTRTTFAGGPGQGTSAGSCRQFNGDPSGCTTAWHVTTAGLPASCFLVGGAAGNNGGWKYIEEGFNAIGPKVANGNKLAVCLGCNDTPAFTDSASGAFDFGFDASLLPGMGWTRTRVTDPNDIEDFFNNTGGTTISQAGLLYMPSDDGNVDGGILGQDARCRGCGPKNVGRGRCTNTCGPPPTCLDGGRTVAAGGPSGNACFQFSDQSACELAWHVNKFGAAATCRWDGLFCRGCGKNNPGACTNTCVPAPTCIDGTRTIDTGGPGNEGGQGCRRFSSNMTSCLMAWHTIGSFAGVSCHWTGSECVPCNPANELDGTCTNTCGPALAPTCDDVTRTIEAGGPQDNACQQFSGDSATCNAAWHLTRGGDAASCFGPDDQISIVNENADKIGDFVAAGGGLFTHTQDEIGGGWDWLRTLVPGLVAVEDDGCRDDLVHATAAGAATVPGLDAPTLCEITRFRARFAGDFGGLHVLGAGDCTRPVFACADPSRTNHVRGEGTDGGACREFDGDQTACEQAWHVTDDDGDFPASCFFCTTEDGQCDNVGECRGCGETNSEDGLCTNTCFDPEQSFCLDDSRTDLLVGGNVCMVFAGDRDACERAWHVDDAGEPASCFVCQNDERECEGPGDCRGCGRGNRGTGLCENTCAEEIGCQDRKRKTAAGGNGDRGCRQFDGDRKACEKAWHRDDEDVPATCFFCAGTEGKCQNAGECRGCGPANARAKACTDTCGAPVTTAVLLGGCPVTFAPALDHFEGYKLKKAPKLEKNCHLLLDDTVSTDWDGPTEYTVSKVASLLAPADKTQKDVPPPLLPRPLPALGDLVDEATHLVGYAMKRKKGTGKHAARRGVLTLNQFGTLRFDTKKEDRFLALAHKDFDASPPMPDGASTVDHYKCYKIKAAKSAPGSQQNAKGKFLKRQAIVVDQFESGRAYVCQGGAPANVGGACEDDKKCGGVKGAFEHCGPGEGHPDFGAARVYDLKKPTRYCVAVDKATGTDSSCTVTSDTAERPDLALTCYAKKAAKKDGRTGKEKIAPKQQKHVPRPVFVNSWLAEHTFSTNKEEELCVPSTTVEPGTTS